MTETEFQSQIVALCKQMGLLTYHTHDSRRSDKGFPDLVIVGRKGVLFRELKTETGKLSPEQRHWLDCLWAAGMDAGLWRPRDWPDRITRELRGLGGPTLALPAPTQAEVRKMMADRSRK